MSEAGPGGIPPVQPFGQPSETPDAPNEDRDETMALRELFGHEIEELARKIDVVERDPGHTELLAQNLGDLGLGHEPLLHEDFAEPSTVAFLDGKSLFELPAADDSGGHEKLSQTDAAGHGSAHPNMRLECGARLGHAYP